MSSFCGFQASKLKSGHLSSPNLSAAHEIWVTLLFTERSIQARHTELNRSRVRTGGPPKNRPGGARGQSKRVAKQMLYNCLHVCSPSWSSQTTWVLVPKMLLQFHSLQIVCLWWGRLPIRSCNVKSAPLPSCSFHLSFCFLLFIHWGFLKKPLILTNTSTWLTLSSLSFSHKISFLLSNAQAADTLISLLKLSLFSLWLPIELKLRSRVRVWEM